jgi:hypothetical protein
MVYSISIISDGLSELKRLPVAQPNGVQDITDEVLQELSQ